LSLVIFKLFDLIIFHNFSKLTDMLVNRWSTFWNIFTN